MRGVQVAAGWFCRSELVDVPVCQVIGLSLEIGPEPRTPSVGPIRVVCAPRLHCETAPALTSARRSCAVPCELTARRSTLARSANQLLACDDLPAGNVRSRGALALSLVFADEAIMSFRRPGVKAEFRVATALRM